MIIVWGTRGHEKELAAKPQGVCPHCGASNSFTLRTTYQTFNLYYVIPLAFYGRRYYARCLGCGAVTEIDKKAGKRVSKADGSILQPQDFFAVMQQPQQDPGPAGTVWMNAASQQAHQPGRKRFCGNCGAPIIEGSRFCTSCGKPLD